MSYQRIEVRPIAGALGAEIGGVNVGAMDDETFAEVRRAWLDHLVVFFRDQDITPDDQLAFAKRFGEIHRHPFMQGMDDHPDILEIIKLETDEHTFGSIWHTDQMFNPQPAMATMLYAKETPAYGGDTLFANMYLAYEALSEPMKRVLREVQTWNVGDKSARGRGDDRKERYASNPNMAAKVKDPGNLQTETAHPVIRTHPETGRDTIYVGSHTETLHGFTEEEAAPILAFLRKHTVRPEFTCRFRWQPGSLAIWDNRCVQHHAVADYAGQRRRMHRITIAGDTPFLAEAS